MSSWRLPLLLLFVPVLSCYQQPEVSYVVRPVLPASLLVRMSVRGGPRDSLVLESYASTDILRPSGLSASGPKGEPLRLEVGTRAVRTRARTVSVTRVLLLGPLPDRVLVRYSIDPNVREGNSHTGFSGNAFGELNGRFALVSGRNTFLVPRVGPRATVGVRFDLPSDWQAFSSLPASGPARRPGADGRYAFEDLVGATIGFGRFRERSVQVSRTRYSFLFESGVSAEQEAKTVDRLVAVARYLRALFGRDLGATYRTIVAPETPRGDEVEGNGWADGQGGTLAPATATRVHRFALRLLDAYLVDPPYRSEVRDPEEFWFVDGVRNLYAWRATARTGLLSEDEVTQETISAYVQTLNSQGVERNLERLYASTENTRIGREFAAPAALLCLDRLIQANTSGTERLDDVVRRMFRGGSASRISAALPPRARAPWEAFRARFVRGAEPFDLRGLITLRAPLASPDPGGGAPVRRLTLVYTGHAEGYLENCGCKVNQAGGVARRATFLRRLRRNDPGIVLLDAGNAFAEPVGEMTPSYLSCREQEFYLRTMDIVRYDAAAVGRTELLYGSPHFREMTRGTTTPFLAANVSAGGTPVAPPDRIIERGPLRIAVIGVFDPPRGRTAGLRFEQNATDLSFGDPVEALRQDAGALRDRADLVIALGDIRPPTIRRIAAECFDVDVVLSSCMSAPVLVGTGPGAEAHLEDRSGFIGRTLVLYAPLQHYGIQVARLELDRGSRIVSAHVEEHRLDSRIPDDPRMRALLSNFYDEVGRSDSAQASVPPLFAWDPGRLNGDYVGAARCRSCHEVEYAQWRSTAHAAAFKTLLDRHRYFQPRCVSCHVVGYGTPHGYRVGDPEEPLGNVQCEVCHGPGGKHVRRPDASSLQRSVPERVCLECHTPSHSDAFLYAAKLPFVVHPQDVQRPVVPPATGRADSGSVLSQHTQPEKRRTE